jgi:hypothetical protein
VASTDTDEPAARAAVVPCEVIEDRDSKSVSCLTYSSRPVGVVIVEAPSMLQAHTNAVARGLAAGEAHELSTEMMT